MDIVQIIESIQASEYSRKGVGPEQIVQYEIDKELGLLKAAVDEGLISYELYDQCASRQRSPRMPDGISLTQYEAGTDIELISEIWRLVEQNLNRRGIAIEQRPTVIATTPSANFNACAIPDSAGKFGLLFGRGILGLGTQIVTNLAPIVSRGDRQKPIYVSKRDILAEAIKDESKAILLTGIAELFANFPVVGGVAMNADWVHKERFDVQHSHGFVTAVLTGYNTFIIGHEFGHLYHNHLRRREPLPAPKQVRYLERELERYDKTYRCRFGLVDRGAMEKRACYQEMEHEADLFAMTTISGLLDELALDDEDRSAMLGASMIGVTVFFRAMDILERTMYTLKFGIDPDTDPILSADYRLQDVFLRDNHPHPLSRLDRILSAMGHDGGYASNDFLGSVNAALDYSWLVAKSVCLELHSRGTRPSNLFDGPYSDLDELSKLQIAGRNGIGQA
jgi:hypothetical protein